MMTFTDLWVCVDCYWIHHYGTLVDSTMVFGLHDPAYDADNSEDAKRARAEAREAECLHAYMKLGGDRYVSDNSDSETGEGIHEFSWSRCDCCGSHLGGSRYRLAVHDA